LRSAKFCVHLADSSNIVDTSSSVDGETPEETELIKIDKEYLDAVSRKDMKKVTAMIARRASEAGYTIGPVYHGSPDIRFINTDYAFKSIKERYGHGDEEGVHWFTKSYKTAKTYANDRRAFDYQNAEAGVYAAYLKLNNSLEIDASGKQWRDAQNRGKTRNAVDQARQEGKDSIIIRNVQDDYNTGAKGHTTPTTTYAVFSSSRIKSSDVTYDESKKPIPLSKRFDSSKKDIRY
jgi:hypothetical protein